MTSPAPHHPGWREAEEISRRVVPPVFPDRTFLVTDHGAIGDGRSDCTAAFRRAIRACHAAGGGRVVVPPGLYLTGPVHLRSNVNLHLHADATIRFSTDPAACLPLVRTRWQGVELFNYSPFVYAFGQENIGITGAGTLDGQAGVDHWWPWAGAPEFGWRPGQKAQADDWRDLADLAQRGVPVERRIFGPGRYLRPNFVETIRCRNVVIEGIRIVRSPMWEIHPVLCHNVLVSGVDIDSPGPNNDGCDPESSRDVVIRDCSFDVGDDCIAIKSGREEDGARVNVPCENVLIENCDLRMRYGAITIGSELTGGVRNVFVRDCRIGGPGLYFGLYIKTNSVRGGYAENIHLDRIEVTNLTKEFVTCDFHRGEGDTGPRVPLVRHIDIRNVTVHRARRTLLLAGYERAPIQDVRLTNCRIGQVEETDRIDHVEGLVIDNVSSTL